MESWNQSRVRVDRAHGTLNQIQRPAARLIERTPDVRTDDAQCHEVESRQGHHHGHKADEPGRQAIEIHDAERGYSDRREAKHCTGICAPSDRRVGERGD